MSEQELDQPAILFAQSCKIARVERECDEARAELERLKDDYGELHGRAMLYLVERGEAQSVARKFWGTMKMYVRHQALGGLERVEEWIAEQIKAHPWLEEVECEK